MVEFIKNYKKYIMALALFFVFVSLSGTTYSLFVNTNSTSDFSYNTGLLDLKFEEDEQINLTSAFPIIDSEAIKSDPYKLTIKNVGTIAYIFDLQMLSSDSNNAINSKYIKFKVNDDIPHSLSDVNNVIASKMIIYPDEEISFKINVWLDYDTPNDELGKVFSAKLVTTGYSTYKTLDSSSANHPKLNNDMIPVYYDGNNNVWRKADGSNSTMENEWYNYDMQKWANSVIVDNNDKIIYDITGNHNVLVKDVSYNNGNLIISNNYLDLGFNNNNDMLSGIFKIRFDNLEKEKYYLLSNDKFNYYYDNETKKFVFKILDETFNSGAFFVTDDKWYIVGFTYDGNKLSLYADGLLMNSFEFNGSLSDNSNLLIGANQNSKNMSELVFSDIYLYSDILTEKEINENYGKNINLIDDNLICGFNKFIPMTKRDYYLSQNLGYVINNNDINEQYVWIPKFKYKLWNVTSNSDKDSYDALNNGIDIVFEKGNESSGVIYCKEFKCYSDNAFKVLVNDYDNGKYYTHPAFNGITGIWVSKYEVSSVDPIREKNLVESIGNIDFESINNLITSNNGYGVIKNKEYGALVYLSHSKYGLCKDNKCVDAQKNISNVNGNNVNDSTTGNMYGVFDLAGNKLEGVMAKYEELKNDNVYDYYYSDDFILGDATKELNNWFSNNLFINSENNLLVRGGSLSDNGNIFTYNGINNLNGENISTRVVIR